MFLKVRPKKSSLNLGNYTKIATRYCGPFEVLAKIGPISYGQDLPSCISIDNVFHVSLLKKYIPDTNHVIDWNVIQVIRVLLFSLLIYIYIYEHGTNHVIEWIMI